MEAYKKLLVVMALVVAAVAVADGQAVLCNMSIAGLMECQPAVSQTNPKAPTATCCSDLKSADLECLCQKAKSPQNVYNISIDRAKEVLGLCKIKTPANCA